MLIVAVLALGLATTTGWAQAGGAAAGGNEGGWVNVTNNVGGEKWADYGMHMLTGVPSKDIDEVVAGISGAGLWSTTDGAVWKHLGDTGKTQITSRPTGIVWDPKDPNVFWVTAIYGAGLFKTTDGGKSFEPLGNLQHVDSLTVDFADKDRKLMLICHHETPRSIDKSLDGGKTWTNIGKTMPDKTNHTTNAVIIDPNTYLVNAAGWLQNVTSGIFRTEDGGATWTQVSENGATGAPLVTADGTIFWQSWAGLLKSADKGKTWTKVGGPVKSSLVAVPAGSKLGGEKGGMMGWSDKGIFVSLDGGAKWAPIGGKLPVNPTSAAYNAKRNCLFVSIIKAKQSNDVLWRLDLPK
jgi:hypothetical protein